MNVNVSVSSCADFDSCQKWRFDVGDISTNFLCLLQEVMTLEMLPTSFNLITDVLLGHAMAQFVGNCARSLKVAGSIPDVVIGIFH